MSDEPDNEDVIYLGDIVQPGPESGIDARLAGKYFRVVGFDKDGTFVLSLPYKDQHLTQPFIPPHIKGSARDEMLREFDRRGQGKNWRPTPPVTVN